MNNKYRGTILELAYAGIKMLSKTSDE
jgi:hypothetical protein